MEALRRGKSDARGSGCLRREGAAARRTGENITRRAPMHGLRALAHRPSTQSKPPSTADATNLAPSLKPYAASQRLESGRRTAGSLAAMALGRGAAFSGGARPMLGLGCGRRTGSPPHVHAAGRRRDALSHRLFGVLSMVFAIVAEDAANAIGRAMQFNANTNGFAYLIVVLVASVTGGPSSTIFAHPTS